MDGLYINKQKKNGNNLSTERPSGFTLSVSHTPLRLDLSFSFGFEVSASQTTITYFPHYISRDLSFTRDYRRLCLSGGLKFISRRFNRLEYIVDQNYI
ncbi:hypothetical protein L6452_12265 [Arctium lappa]|uniref:Uncharacterized protein n=1 Tax=Arctium lappa TaxID=4217 RepID=A0ACB9DR05_ARCLA|nr:hypothetical protein L6452_12265 [Arctium lappa]